MGAASTCSDPAGCMHWTHLLHTLVRCTCWTNLVGYTRWPCAGCTQTPADQTPAATPRAHCIWGKITALEASTEMPQECRPLCPSPQHEYQGFGMMHWNLILLTARDIQPEEMHSSYIKKKKSHKVCAYMTDLLKKQFTAVPSSKCTYISILQGIIHGTFSKAPG